MLDKTDLVPAERAERIRAAIAAVVPQRMTKAALAEAVGVSAQAITGWEKTGSIGRATLRKLAHVTGRPLQFFLVRDWQHADDWEDVRGYSQAVGLGRGAEAQEYAETHALKFKASSLARKQLRADRLAVMYGDGDSMEPRIRQGDAILFDTSDTHVLDGAVYVVSWNGEIYVKRAELIDDTVFFRADNPAGDHSWGKPKRMDSPRAPIEILGRVRWIGSWEQ